MYTKYTYQLHQRYILSSRVYMLGESNCSQFRSLLLHSCEISFAHLSTPFVLQLRKKKKETLMKPDHSLKQGAEYPRIVYKYIYRVCHLPALTITSSAPPPPPPPAKFDLFCIIMVTVIIIIDYLWHPIS